MPVTQLYLFINRIKHATSSNYRHLSAFLFIDLSHIPNTTIDNPYSSPLICTHHIWIWIYLWFQVSSNNDAPNAGIQCIVIFTYILLRIASKSRLDIDIFSPFCLGLSSIIIDIISPLNHCPFYHRRIVLKIIYTNHFKWVFLLSLSL